MTTGSQTSRFRRPLIVACGAIAVGFIAASLTLGRTQDSQADDQHEMERVVSAIAAESAAVTRQYVSSPESVAGVVASVFDEVTNDLELRHQLFEGLLATHHQVDAIFVGFPNGDFSFFARADESQGIYRSREITAGPNRVVYQAWYDGDRRVIRSGQDATNDYDPRSRPWYGRAASGVDQSWTDPYRFSSSQEIGVTFSEAVRDETGELRAVIGVDVRLAQLVSFMRDHTPGANGIVSVLNMRGQILASSEMDNSDIESTELDLAEASPATIAAIRAWESQPPTGSASSDPSLRSVMSDSERFVQVVPASTTNTWFLSVDADRNDFLAAPPTATSVKVLAAFLTSAAVTALLLSSAWAMRDRSASLHTAALVDHLTGLANRAGVLQGITDAQATVSPNQDLVVAIVDIDRFKAVNDTWGHDVGDQALCEAARRISGSAHARGLSVGRLGGDEFVIYGAVEAGTQLDDVWVAIASRVSAIDNLNGLPLDIGASVGVSQHRDNVNLELAVLLKRADTALYQAKANGGGTAVLAHEFQY